MILHIQTPTLIFSFLRDRLILAPDSYLNRFYSDGVCPEGIQYGLWGINNLLPFIKILGRLDGIDYFHDWRFNVRSDLQKISTWLSYQLFPFISGTEGFQCFNQINDSSPFGGTDPALSLLSNLLVLSQLYGDGISQWLFNNTVGDISNLIYSANLSQQEWSITHSLSLAFLTYYNGANSTPITGVMPINPGSKLPKATLFPHGGLAYIRTSSNWADNSDIQFGFEAHRAVDPITGYFSIIHNHEDKNSFLLDAFGDEYIADLGFHDEEANEHNYILIDSKGEARNPSNPNALKDCPPASIPPPRVQIDHLLLWVLRVYLW